MSAMCLTGRDHEASIMRRSWPARGCCAMDKNEYGFVDNILLIFFCLFLYYFSSLPILFVLVISCLLFISIVIASFLFHLLFSSVFLFLSYSSLYFYQYMVVFLFNNVIYVFLLFDLCILIVQLPWLRFFHAFFSVVRQMPGYNSPRRGMARTVPIYFCVVLCIVFVFFFVLCIFLCKYVLYYCHRVSTKLQLTNISYIIMTPFLFLFAPFSANVKVLLYF
jgi:hypothetical protein